MDELPIVEPGGEYAYEAEVVVRPELTLSSTGDLSITAPAKEATQAEIDAQIEQARARYATLEPVDGRGVENDDFLLISFVGTVDGEGYEGNTVDKYLYEMGKGLMPAEFDQGLLGAMPEQEVRIEFAIPETSSVEEYVGKTAEFDVTVHEIKAKKLPEVDDEFALSVGGFESVEDMNTQLKLALDRQAEMNHLQGKERALRELLASRLEGDVPQSMIDSRGDTLLRDFLVMLETREIPLEEYFAGTGMGMPELEAEMKVQGEQAVKEDLALEALFRAEGLEITQEDIDKELEDFARSSDTSPEDARKRWEELGLMSVIREQIMHRKAVEWLMETAEVTVAEPADAAGEPGEEKPTPKKKPAAKKKAAPKKVVDSE
jgi:trigger factor